MSDKPYMKRFLRKLRIAWAFLGLFDCPFFEYRIGPRRAWQIATIIQKHNQEIARIRGLANER